VVVIVASAAVFDAVASEMNEMQQKIRNHPSLSESHSRNKRYAYPHPGYGSAVVAYVPVYAPRKHPIIIMNTLIA